MESNEEIRRYARRDRQMNRDTEAALQWMLIQIHFQFDQMRDQLDAIQQANSNYEENKSSCSQSHSSTQSFEEKSEESPDSKPK